MADTYRLWKVAANLGHYADQFGIEHPAKVIVDEVDVTVVERRPAIGMWGRAPAEGMAVRALADDGREFTCNWKGTYADDSMFPLWLWSDGWEQAGVASLPAIYPDGRKAVAEPGGDGLRLNAGAEV